MHTQICTYIRVSLHIRSRKPTHTYVQVYTNVCVNIIGYTLFTEANQYTIVTIQKQMMFHFWLIVLKTNSQKQNINQTFTIYSPSLPFTSLRKRRRGMGAKIRILLIKQKERESFFGNNLKPTLFYIRDQGRRFHSSITQSPIVRVVLSKFTPIFTTLLCSV